MLRLAPWSALLALGLLAAAALRVQLGRSSGETAGPVYDPQSYYQLVNQEIAPHLEFCPLHATPLTVASFEEGSDARATELLEGVVTDGASAPPRRKSQPGPGAGDGTPEANAPARAPMRCACPHRLSAIFCLRDDPGVDRSRIERYARLSPLLDDLAIPSRWRLEVSRSGSAGSPEVQRLSFRLIPGSHRQRLPGGAIRPRYDGTIYYHPTPARAVLLDAGGNERTLGRGGAAGSKPIDAEMARWREEQQDALAGGSLHRELLRSDTLVLRHGDDSVTLRLAPEGNLLLVTVPEVRPGSDFSVSIDGAPLPSMRRRWILGLHPLQQIQLRWDAQPSLSLRFLSHRAGVLSETHFGTSGNERVFDEASGAEDYVRALAGTIREATDSLGEAYRECGRELTRPPGLSQPNMEALATADVWLTLDQVLQGAAQRALVRYAERGPLSRARLGLHRGEWRDGAELAPPPHLSLLVMDADRGDVLATAAYPSTQEVRRLLGALAQERSGPVALLAEDLESEQRRISLHLRPHPIGSVFKPLFAWSAGETDRALIDFTLPRLHAEDWRFGPGGKVQNRLVDQCLISTRRVENNTRWHFERAYLTPGFSDSCTGGAGPGDSEDLCLALATSDTYWFVELAARVMARARGLALPPLETPADQRDYGLSEVCAPQVLATRERGPRQVVCEGAASAAGRAQAMQSWFPVSCQSKDPNPICGMADLLGIQLQPIGDLSRPGTTDSFLGPLHGLVERLAAPLGDRCPELQTWRVRDESGFRWLVPSQTVWRADLMHRCTPDIEVFVEGGHINYWDNIYLGQSLGRLFIGNRALTARMVAQVEVPDAAAEGGRSEVAPLAPATPATPATGAAAGTAQQAAPAAVLAVSESCAGAADTPRCRVLRGLELAIRRGTLAELRELPAWLGAEHGGKAGGLEIGLWGKTGTLRDVYPVYQLERRPGGSRWVRSTTMRKSLHTALLLEVRMPDEARRPAQGPGAGPGTGAGTGSATAGRRVRHFVVYLWAEGVDDQFTSVEGAVPFFRPGRPGRSGRRPNGRDDRGGPGEAAPGAEVLRELINFALAEQG